MKMNRHDAEMILEQIASEISNTEIDEKVTDAAAKRVWTRLNSQVKIARAETLPADQIRTCADFQTLIPAFEVNQLSEARKLLFEDHIHECIPCRKALKEFRSGPPFVAPARTPSQKTTQWKTRKIAAAAVIFITLSLIGFGWLKYVPTTSANAATIENITGGVYRVAADKPTPARTGEKLGVGERIRTGKDAHATLRLADGSLVEVKERTEFSVKSRANGLTVMFDRGSIIVQASKRQSGTLNIATPDSLVSVTGTIFSVNSGIKGSRISVMEGEVRLEANGKESVLHPGDQMTTSKTLESLPIQDEIAWSQDADRYRKLLGELSAIREAIHAQATRPELRYDTSLLNLAPSDTVFYAALPNLGETVRSANQIIQERLRDNQTLKQWWEEMQGGKKGVQFNRLAQDLSGFLDLFGDEILLTGGNNEFLILAKINEPNNFQESFKRRLTELTHGDKGALNVIFLDAAALQSPQDEKSDKKIFVLANNGVFAASSKAATLQKAFSESQFSQTQFYAALADQYRTGVSVLIGGDLEAIIAAGKGIAPDVTLQRLGLSNLRHFIVASREVDGTLQNNATLTFNESQHGIGSWLAAPGPMGALEYISGNAIFAMAAVVKNPTALTDDIIAALEATHPDMKQKIAALEAKHGLSFRDDFIAPLGGEFAVAVDGPLLPSPAWKLIVEVYDAGRFQHSVESFVEELNKLIVGEGGSPLRWEHAEVSGRTFYRLSAAGVSTELHYVYANGYFIAAPNRTLVERAIAYHDAGTTLPHSPRFRAAFPINGDANFSVLAYQNITPTLAEITNSFDSSDQKSRSGLGANEMAHRLPALLHASASPNRIVFTSSGGTGLSLADIVALKLLPSVQTADSPIQK